MEKNILKDLINKALKEVKLEEQKRPDYPDIDGGGDTKEPMEKAFKDKKIKEAEMTAGAENTKFTIKVDVSNKQSETKLGIRIQLTPKDGMLESDVRDKLEVAITKKLNTSLGEFDIQVSKDTDVPDPAIIGFFIPLSQIKNMIVKSIKGGTAPTSGAPTPPPPARPTPPTPAVSPAKPATPTAPATTNEGYIGDEKLTDVMKRGTADTSLWHIAKLEEAGIINDSNKQAALKAVGHQGGMDEMIDGMINETIIKEMRVRDLKEISKVVIKEDFYAFINAGQNVIRTMEERGMDNGKKYLEYLVKHNIM